MLLFWEINFALTGVFCIAFSTATDSGTVSSVSSRGREASFCILHISWCYCNCHGGG